MMTMSDVAAIHDIVIEKYGGSPGVRDPAGLESALARPFQTFDGNELYPSPLDKATAIFDSLISNHPFIDGNKRTAYIAMRLMPLEHKLDVAATEDQKHAFVVGAAEGRFKYEAIHEWLSIHVVSKP